MLRYDFTSLTTPDTVYDIDMKTGERTLLQARPGARRLRPGQLRHRARVGDRARRREDAGVARLPQGLQEGRHRAAAAVRLRLVRHLDRSAFLARRAFSLLDRGFVYAIAHIRGGRRWAAPWYENGKLLNKKNTFTDFIDVDALPRRARLRREGQGVRRGRQRRRPADGRGRQHGAAGLTAASSRRCRSSTSSRRCSTRASR